VDISNYKLQYGGVVAAEVAAAKPDLFITEGAPVSGTPELTDAEVADLRSAGTRVVGYVNAAVTDDNRPYWNAAWTANGSDTGKVNPEAPDWLKTGVKNEFGIIADIRNADWRQLVIDQAVDLVTRGYSGVFLDDVAQYYALGQPAANVSAFADAMLMLVTDVKTAIRAVNSEAVVIVNASPYIVTDATGGATGSAATDFLASADAMLLESYFGINRAPEKAAVQHALETIKPHMPVLAMEFGGTPYQNYLYEQQAAALGIIAGMSASSAYDQFATTSASSTEGDDTLKGTYGSEVIMALAGDDRISAGAGDDTVYGGVGNDRISGGSGADTMYGSSGNDTYFVTDKDDTVIEHQSRGQDRVYSKVHCLELAANVEELMFYGTGSFVGTGNALSNILRGGSGNDRFMDLAGGNDKFFGRSGSDTVDYRGATKGITLNLATKTHAGGAKGDTFSSIENYFGSDSGADRMTGGKSAVAFFGFAGNDRLTGGKGKDNLSGGAGNDIINGGLGNDVMAGGAGSDVFYFSKSKFGDDLITGFQDGLDRIDLSTFDISRRDLTIVKNGERDVGVFIQGYHSESIILKSAEPIKLSSVDFIF
jgi:uncharacterized protein (TIGR01370 family)